MLNSDIRGIIFLGVLLLNCLITFTIGTAFKSALPVDNTPPEKIATCNATSLKDDERFSPIPLNINIVVFTFAYLLYILVKENMVNYNVPTIVFFTILLASMLFWEFTNQCVDPLKLILALILGGGFGALFSYGVSEWSKNLPGLQFFNNLTNEDVCKRVSDEVFECDVA